MQTILTLAVFAGVLPFVIGWFLVCRSGERVDIPPLGSVLLCALAFNVTFGWQELWLVISKAFVPGLHPVLFHNDHQWRGEAPVAELLQGAGAVATLVEGLVAFLLLRVLPALGPTWRALLFWLAFQGLFQALSQLAIGSMVPGNDVGRALAYLGVNAPLHAVLLAIGIAGMAGAGLVLARAMPNGIVRAAAAPSLLAIAVGCVLISVPFRVPRGIVEVVLVPGIVNLMGIGWLTVGLRWAGTDDDTGSPPKVVAPLMALLVLLLFFQIVLRPGIAF